MAKRDETLSTSSSVNEAIDAGTQTLESLGLKVKKTDNATLDAHAGSRLLVYWIGLFLPSSAMPVKVHYAVSDQGDSRTIQMHTKSSVFLSFYVWKYKARANEVAIALKQGVAAKVA